MAKISSPWVGIASGKLGDGVYYNSGGRQCARARNRSPKNPKTMGQAVQRMILSAAAKWVSAAGSVLDHSWENVQAGNFSLNYARRVTMDYLRDVALTPILDPDAQASPAEFPLKGSPSFVVAGLPISRGSLTASLPLSFGLPNPEQGGRSLTVFSLPAGDNVLDVLPLAGLRIGDQLSFIRIVWDEEQVVASYGDGDNLVTNYAVRFEKASVVIPERPQFAQPTLAPLADAWELTGDFAVQSVLANFGATDSRWSFEVGDDLRASEHLIAAAVVVCRMVDGKPRYTATSLNVSSSELDYNNAPDVYPSFMDGGVSLLTRRFLDEKAVDER